MGWANLMGFAGIPAISLLLLLVPWVIGFAYVRPDANRRGQPGWLWALATVPLGWVSLLAYLVVRSLQTS